MKHFAYISLIIWFVTTLPAQAQYEYTLKQCLEEGLLNNYSLRISRNEIGRASCRERVCLYV